LLENTMTAKANNPKIAACPSCSAKYKVPPSVIGKKVTCQKCQKVFVAFAQDKTDSWIDCRRRLEQVSTEKRRFPRIEVHFPVRIGESKILARLTDLSQGGAFVETNRSSLFQRGETLDVSMSLPTESEPVSLKAKIVNVEERGIGIQFVDLTEMNQTKILFCFDTYKDTIPLRRDT
jgi:predicted Zn finger-like uncharacterized protein